MKVVIVGGVAGGAAAAARARRLNEKCEIIILERGEYVSFANCGLPYYLGGVIKEKDALLVQTPQGFKERFNVDIRAENEVLSIDRANKKVSVKDLKSGDIYSESYDYLLLSPGAEPIIPPIEGADLKCVYKVRTIPDIEKIKVACNSQNVKKAVVIGAGFIGLEMVENLRELGLEVDLIEKLDQVMPPFDKEMAVILHRELMMSGVRLHLREGAIKIKPHVSGNTIHTSTGKEIPADIVIMAIGVRPEIQLAKESGLKIARRGIGVDQTMRTSDSSIFAIGDAVETLDPICGDSRMVPLAGPAAKQALVAINNIFGIEDEYKGSFGTSILKVFSLTAAMTGTSEKALKEVGKPYEKIYTFPAQHAGYYPGASQMAMKLLFDPKDGRVLGTQIVGSQGVDKRIDVLATAIQHSLTVKDLAELELSYAPPYGSAKDAVNLAGMAALNHLRGLTKLIHWEQITEKEFLLDVRTPIEFERGQVPGSMNIPLNELRKRLSDLPKNRQIAVFCQVGIRGHIATRILVQNGFDARNVSGGYQSYCNYRAAYLSEGLPECEVKMSEESFCTAPTGTPMKGEKKDITYDIDLRGLQCPGPILKLKETLDKASVGEIVRVLSSDSGFALDLPGWCASLGNHLLGMTKKEDVIEAWVMKGEPLSQSAGSTVKSKGTTIVVFSDAMDRVLASFIIARTAAASGRKATMFFTFWGLNVLKKKHNPSIKKDFLSKMFGWMLPSSASRLKLSKLNMGGLGTTLMKYVMRQNRVESVPQMLEMARKDGIKLVACSMSMEIMGIKKEELIDGVEIGGAAAYISDADKATHNLFI